MADTSLTHQGQQTETLERSPEESELTVRARALAQMHTNITMPAKRRVRPSVQRKAILTGYLNQYKKVVLRAVQYFRNASDQELALSYSAEWMLDNYYVVLQALREIDVDLPANYYEQLPLLVEGQFTGYPRVYALARELVVNSRVFLDIDRMKNFVLAYQTIVPLTMGELWALPIMLRLAVVQALVVSVSRIIQLEKPVSDHVAAGINISEVMTDDEVVANTIISLRTLASADWQEIFEDLSLVEQMLRQDPSGIYADMDFQTRDRYRKAVEQIAWGVVHSEQEVSRKAVFLAQQAAEKNGSLKAAHVGYYLLNHGRYILERVSGYRPTLPERLARWAVEHPTFVYLGSIFALTAAALALLVGYAASVGAASWLWAIIGLLLLIPALTGAVDLVNSIITHSVQPDMLPKLDFSEGIPDDCFTLVVIPALLTGSDDLRSLYEQLEQHYLRNQDANLGFALLTDFKDAPEQNIPEDDELIEEARQAIISLNRRHFGKENGSFFLLHRERQRNVSEGVWMGWERKRGKLHELNQLIMGQNGTSYSVTIGDLALLPKVRYVITLDADSILPIKTAHRLVAALAHPLNHAEFHPEKNEVVAGYTILQPRTEINPSRANQSQFTRLFAGDTALDLYTLAVSDVYQDFFGEGSYIGKGIYDVRAFERSLEGRAPENALLSHDLFEGMSGRAALITDAVLIEDYPPNYLAYIQRTHRWIRGDWQLLPWLGRRVPGADGELHPNHFSVIDRWKILDNLRRSLVMPVLLVFLISGWLWLPGSPLVWTLVGTLSIALPIVSDLAVGLRRLFQKTTPSEIPNPSFHSVKASFLRWLVALIHLPYEALYAGHAILSTLRRVFITRRNLLRWTTSAHSAKMVTGQITRHNIIQHLLVSFVFTLVVFIGVWLLRPTALAAAVPLLFAWLLSPEIAYRISQPRVQLTPVLRDDQVQSLRQLARRTWLFFEQFVGPEDHWLPPDHYQEFPRGVTAHRTSPTNIGLGLLSTLSAYDLGYLGLLELVARLRSSFESLEQMQKFRGHFLNWYDTRSLTLLPPAYVSTVDSGNLAIALVTLGQGCLELHNAPVLRWETWQGLLDTLDLLLEPLSGVDDPEAKDALSALEAQLKGIRGQILDYQNQPEVWAGLAYQGLPGDAWEELDRRLLEVVNNGAQHLSADRFRMLTIGSRSVRSHREGVKRDIELLMPWVPYIHNPPALFIQQQTAPIFREAWQMLLDVFPSTPSLSELTGISRKASSIIEGLVKKIETTSAQQELWEEALDWCRKLEESLGAGDMSARILQIGLDDLNRLCQSTARGMDFGFLFNEQRQVFHIGYNVELGRLDSNFYDLLASEARIASLYAIAKGDVPLSHWLHLSRPFTQVNGTRALLSWSATMFEYLMPVMHFRSYEGTLLHQSVKAAIDRQIEYGREKGTPWGISESGYYRFDENQNYQYRAFGVPGLGYKRGLSEDHVIAPYASFLALPMRPVEVMDNLEHLERFGMRGVFGLYEAVDFTPVRLALGERYNLVKSYMAHHQGMILLSLVNYLDGDSMVKRTHSDPLIQSVELLLQEGLPEDAPLEQFQLDDAPAVRPAAPKVVTNPWRVRSRPPQPRLHYLSNGRYTVMIASSGSGYSTWKEVDLTRWRPDTTLNPYGTWIYLQDRDDSDLWSATYQPTAVAAQSSDVFFNAHLAHFRRRDREITTEVEITVSPDDDIEVRLVTLHNHGNQTRRLRLTSYGEVILARQADDERHPAFNKLFIQSEYLPDENALLFLRRTRSYTEKPIFLAHALIVEKGITASKAHEAFRGSFIGRGRTVRRPILLSPRAASTRIAPLTNTTGATLDPIMSLSQDVELEPHGTIRLALVTLASDSRQQVLAMLERYSELHQCERAFEQARLAAEFELRQLAINTPQLRNIQHLLSVLIYPHYVLRASPDRLSTNVKGQPGLWAHGISGDYPVVLVRIHSSEELSLVHELLQAHSYWRKRRLLIDLVIINEQGVDYGQEINSHLYRLVTRMKSDAWLNRRGGIFLLSADRINESDRVLLESAARAVFEGSQGPLEEQIKKMADMPVRLPVFTPTNPDVKAQLQTQPVPRPDNLLFDNGLGGFSPDGREYLIYLTQGKWTPAPWSNVIANPDFGFMVTDSGSGYTWSLNSGENRLTPWSNDPVSDIPGEAIYLRDEETGQVWSPTPLPARDEEPYLVRHGAGYSIFEHHSMAIRQTLTLFVAHQDPVKIIHLRLENTSDRPRRLTATYLAEWVLGVSREASAQYIIPSFDDESQSLLVRNPYNPEFGERVAFAAASQPLHGLTADREEFFGRLGTRTFPVALRRVGLSGQVRAGTDPCAALQIHIDLAPGETQTVFFLLGQGADREQALELVRRYQNPDQVEQAWQSMTEMWDEILGTVQVSTPDPAMDLLLNRWLLYQALSCRIWGRSAFYQSSGAYGFRDQLQDVMCLVHAAPSLAREHILRSTRHQFEAGDVLHWWHPPSGRGVRTRYSDDLLWLPFVTAYYIEATGDHAILEEKTPFLSGPLLEPGEKERYGFFESTRETYTVFEHCRRAIDKGTTAGAHGLPLIGSGDWNDGMNRVGVEGRGESVWLGWFLYDTSQRFARLCEQRGETEQAELYRERAERLRQSLEASAWDGKWYLRAFYDDGSPLGSSSNRECQIDSIAQSWSILSGAGEPERARQAMQSVSESLVDEEEGLVLLFTPPFDTTPRDPGYIKGYLPGIRENGGQYTHAAIWTVWAYAQQEQGDYAERLFRLINPIYHSDTPEKVRKYVVEPYVIAADVYSVPPHTGHGGWTWYTGSSGWMYRLGVEALLGLRRVGDALVLEPHIPSGWKEYSITYQWGSARYQIRVDNSAGAGQGVRRVQIDGHNQAGNQIPLVDDGQVHEVLIELGQG